MRFRTIAIATAIALIAPATWLFGSGLYLGLVASGTDPTTKMEARYVLWRDVVRARSRRLEVSSLGRAPTPPGRMPVYVYNPPLPERLSGVLPTCPDHVIVAENPATDSVFRAGAMPVLFPQRAALEEDATYVAHADKFSVPELALLHACFRATPFGAQCDSWMALETPSRDDVMSRLIERGWLGQRSGTYCWQLPEFRLPS